MNNQCFLTSFLSNQKVLFNIVNRLIKCGKATCSTAPTSSENQVKDKGDKDSEAVYTSGLT